MNASTVHTLSLFTRRWLAETVRLRESGAVRMDDTEALAQACRQSESLEERILLRAGWLAERDGTLPALLSWRSRAKWLLLLLCALALVAGFSSALAVLGDGSRPVNVIWALGGLLGFNLLMLLIWLLNLLPGLSRGSERGGLPGRLWLALSDWFSARARRSSAASDAPSPGLAVSRALAELLHRSGSALWLFSTVTHLVWLLALSGAALGLLLSLALRSYIFVWETTILPADSFVQFAHLIGWLPAQLGFSVPDAEAVRSSGAAPAGLPAGDLASLQDETVRRAWSSWFLGTLLIYGILPRLLLGLLSVQRLGARLKSLRLDRAMPAYATLVARLRPSSEAAGVLDQAPASLYQRRMGHSSTAGSRQGVIIGLEIGADFPWSQLRDSARSADEVLLLEPVDSREQRRDALAVLADNPPARLLLICDPRLSPDRGTLNWLVDASLQAASTAVLLPDSLQASQDRLDSWRQQLGKAGLPPENLYREQSAALHWVHHGQ